MSKIFRCTFMEQKVEEKSTPTIKKAIEIAKQNDSVKNSIPNFADFSPHKSECSFSLKREVP